MCTISAKSVQQFRRRSAPHTDRQTQTRNLIFPITPCGDKNIASSAQVIYERNNEQPCVDNYRYRYGTCIILWNKFHWEYFSKHIVYSHLIAPHGTIHNHRLFMTFLIVTIHTSVGLSVCLSTRRANVSGSPSNNDLGRRGRWRDEPSGAEPWRQWLISECYWHDTRSVLCSRVT